MISAISLYSLIANSSPMQGLPWHRVGWKLRVIPNSETAGAEFLPVVRRLKKPNLWVENLSTLIKHLGSRQSAKCGIAHNTLDRQMPHDYSPSLASWYSSAFKSLKV